MQAYQEGSASDTWGAPTEAGQEKRPASDHLCAGLPLGRVSCGGSWALAVFCPWGTHGNTGMWVMFSSLETSALAQEAKPGPASNLSHIPRSSMQGADQEAAPDLEGCLPPVVVPPAATAPAAAVEPGLACAASPDLTEAPPPLPKETSLNLLWFLPQRRSCPWKMQQGQPQSSLLNLLSLFYLHSLTCFFYLLSLLCFSFLQWRDSVFYYLGFLGGFFLYFLFLSFISP